jgi:hypothetical protein
VAIVRRVADARPSDPRGALLELQPGAREALRGLAVEDVDWSSPDTVTSWWVSIALYDRRLELAEPSLRAARSLCRFLARFGAVVPRPDQWRRNREALQAQARAPLAEHDPDAPAPELPAGDDVIRVHLWPR